ncbi:hypothetical protein STLA111740_17455 [Stenotrophomonas lactitubi]
MAGLRPAPAEARSTARAKAGFRGLAGRCRSAGAPQVRPCRLGSRLLVCALLRTRQDRGWAGRPALRHRPTSDRFPLLWVGVDLGRHGRSTPCVDALRSILEIFDFDRDSSTHGVDLLATGKLSKAGHCGFAGCEPHGCGDQASMDGFTAPPQTHSAPPSHGMHAVAVASAVAAASAGAGCSPAEPLNRQPAPGTGTLCRHQTTESP